jgi:hypothetical protein
VKIKLQRAKLGNYDYVSISVFVFWTEFILLKELLHENAYHDLKHTLLLNRYSPFQQIRFPAREGGTLVWLFILEEAVHSRLLL